MSKEVTKLKSAPFILSLILILTVLVVTLPVAGLLGLFMLAGPLFAPAVTGIGLGKLVFKNMNRWASGLLGAVIVSVLLLIPMIKWLVGMLCLMFATGYVLQALWQRDRSGSADGGTGPTNGPKSFAENPNASVYGNAQAVPPEGL